MEKDIPGLLRDLAERYENPLQIENVEKCELVPASNQKLLLALNKPRWEGENMHLPEAGQILHWLRQTVISVETSDRQSAVLGLFYTNINPLNLGTHPVHNYGRRRIAIGVFPRYNDILNYKVTPYINEELWESHGEIRIHDGAAAGVDPFVFPNPEKQKGDSKHIWLPEFVFFKESPFKDTHPYTKDISNDHILTRPSLIDNALEENVIRRALWHADRNDKPRLFTQEGCKKFLRNHRGDAKYKSLYEASRKNYRDTSGNPFAQRTTYPQYNY